MLRGMSGMAVLAALCSAAALAFAWVAPARGEGPVVFAAASLKNALDEVNGSFEQRGHARATISYAASSALARQIESGAPADIYLAADLDWMRYLEDRRLVRAGTRTNLLRNEIVLIAPTSSRMAIVIAPGFPLAVLLGDGRLAVGDPAHVPAGKYARSALEALGAWRSVARRLAPAENVRAALNFVARGEAPLGIVYRTDAAADQRVRIVGTFPAASYPPIVYPVAMLTTGRNPWAPAFLDHLKSVQAAGIFRRHGFMPY